MNSAVSHSHPTNATLLNFLNEYVTLRKKSRALELNLSIGEMYSIQTFLTSLDNTKGLAES